MFFNEINIWYSEHQYFTFVCVCVCVCVHASVMYLSPVTLWPETQPFTVIGVAPYVFKPCLLQCEVCVKWWCLLSDAANYSSNTHPRVRRSNSLTPPVSITQTSDFWSSQVCCSYQQCGMNIFMLLFLLNLVMLIRCLGCMVLNDEWEGNSYGLFECVVSEISWMGYNHKWNVD